MKLFCAMCLAAMSANAGWRLVWSDEFDKPGLPDPARWAYEHGLVRNREAQFYTTNRLENARVEDGCLVIEARRGDYAERARFTSASLTTRGRTNWTYGRFEIRAKIPTARGTWPAIWMLGSNRQRGGWPACGEIDIMEAVGHEPGTIHGTLHTAAYNHRKGNPRGARLAVEAPGTEFHTYAADWLPDRIDLRVDRTLLLSVPRKPDDTGAEWPFDQPFYLILNVAVGGEWGGQKGIDEAAFPQKMLVDYVRVYEQER